jgi:hypothetical protein
METSDNIVNFLNPRTHPLLNLAGISFTEIHIKQGSRGIMWFSLPRLNGLYGVLLVPNVSNTLIHFI